MTGGVSFRGRRVHLMGIGGAGVSALVPLLREAGARVDGCDLAGSATVERLRDEGVPVALGHDRAHLADVDLLVHSSAIPADHAELRAARDAGIAVLSRPACLAELMRGLRTVAVAGSHGKTSTTWMIAHLLTAIGRDPVVAVGGAVPEIGMHGGRSGAGGIFVAEVDESDGGFRHVSPEVAVLTNLEPEHVRHYGSFDALVDAVAAWLGEIPTGGTVILPTRGLDPRIEAGLRCRVVHVGLEDGDVHARAARLGPEGGACTVVAFGEELGELAVPYPGVHMMHNALMAVVAARMIEPACPIAALAGCRRVRRRFTVHGSAAGVRVVEDYGHHPTEIRATIAAARLGGGRVHVIFQPHRFTRTADCWEQFLRAFDEAATLAVLPVYAAGEQPLPGCGGRELAEAIAAARPDDAAAIQFAPRPAQALAFAAAHARAGDTCLVLGAGDVGALASPLLEALS